MIFNVKYVCKTIKKHFLTPMVYMYDVASIFAIQVTFQGKHLINNNCMYLGQLAHLHVISASINWPCCSGSRPLRAYYLIIANDRPLQT